MDKTLEFAIEAEIRMCVLSFTMIAAKYNTTYAHVNMIWELMCENEFSQQ